ncbi:unnamed protein product, partial [Staurois parvus]
MPCVSAHQCLVPVPISAYQCTSMPHISAHLSCFQCHPSMPVSATYLCQSVPPISACPSVPPISVHQCSLSVPISAPSLAHISEGEKSLIYKFLE